MKLCVGSMRSCAVIAFEVILKNQLPVRVDSVGLFVGNLSGVQIVGTQRLSQRRECRHNVTSVLVAINKNETHEGFAANAL